MKKKLRRNLILIILGTLFLLLGVTLIVMYQNLNSFNKTTINVLKFIHEKIVFDYILIIIATVLLSIPFFDKLLNSGYKLAQLKTQKSTAKKNNQANKIKQLEAKIAQLEKENNHNSNDSQQDNLDN